MTWFRDKKVLVPVDFSATSIDGLRSVIGLVEGRNQVHVLYVWPQAMEAKMDGALDIAIRSQKVAKFVASLKETLEESQAHVPNVDVLIGDPASRIVEQARVLRADCIVISSREQVQLGKWFLGSVAERVVQEANCPVLVLKGNTLPMAAKARRVH